MVDGIYTVGGTVQANQRGLYIPRHADQELLHLCRQSEFAYVLTPRQMGKSSLMIRTAEQLIDEGSRAVIIDLALIGVQLSVEQWYQGLIMPIADQLMLDVSVNDWWQAHSNLGVTQRLTRFFQQVVLSEVQSPIVIFVDEIDTTLSLDFTDDFFAAIRSLYVARATQPSLRRLSFVLIGVAMPGDLIRDPKRTPFNIGQRVDLTDSPQEALPFAAGLGLAAGQAEQTLGWVLKWTGGHPYLTQRLCQKIVQFSNSYWNETEVDRLVVSTFLGQQSEQDNNLQFVRDVLTKRAPEPVAVLQTYREIRRGKRPVLDEEQSLVKSHLKLSGVVKREGRILRIRNLIYRRVFDWQWIKTQLPETLWQRIKPVLPLVAFLLAIIIALTGMAGYAQRNASIARINAMEASTSAIKARTSAAEAERQKHEAEKQKHEAERQRDRAEAALQRAKSQTIAAQKNAAEARTQRTRAGTALEEAKRQSTIAQNNSAEAENQAEIARRERLKAEDQAQFALEQQQNAERQSQLALEGKTLAELRAKAAISDNLLSRRPLESLVLAIQATGQSLSVFNQVLTSVQLSLRNAVSLAREQNVLEGHQGPVQSVAVSPDGQTIASGSWDGTVRLWDKRGNLIGEPLRGHQGLVWSVAFSQNGHTLVSSSPDGTVCLWNRRGDLINQFQSDTPILSVAISANGQTIVGGSLDGSVILWNRQGQIIKSLKAHETYARSVAFSADGQTIVSGGWNGDVRLWDREGNAIGEPLLGHQGPISSVDISANGTTIVSGSHDKTIRIWNRQGELIGQPINIEDEVLSVAISSDGQTIVSGDSGGVIHLLTGWSVSIPNEISRIVIPLSGHEGPVNSVAINSDATYVASSGGIPITDHVNHSNGSFSSNINSINNLIYLRSSQGNLNEELFQSPPVLLGTLRASVGNPDVAADMAFIGGMDNTVKLWDVRWRHDFSRVELTTAEYLWSSIRTHTRSGLAYAIPFIFYSPVFDVNLRELVEQNRADTRLVSRPNNWQEGLEEACERLRDHPILKNPQDDITRDAKLTCSSHVWSRSSH